MPFCGNTAEASCSFVINYQRQKHHAIVVKLNDAEASCHFVVKLHNVILFSSQWGRVSGELQQKP